ncbi:hypothetical protein BJ322DRAFT_332924 [Thelephora terrestris]|uniref:Uncharacterized protein n=1 Tax=Thelephora terrestris TaxID=56493 RepID=A0A9P6L2F8_9AGAM|nr:hypothetical protein BJ322DRAFT_332924 [Thelephora terrestris]
MKTVVVPISIFLHLCIPLLGRFMCLRLASKNRALGLAVGVPATIIVVTYIVSTALPVFTNAPLPQG